MLTILYTLSFLFHPLHISVTEIEYNDKVKSLQIISRIFVDDLETAIKDEKKLPNLDILNPKGDQDTKALITEYLEKHFAISLDGKKQKMSFLGYEEENFAFVCYIEIEKVEGFKTLEVENTLITDTYSDQSNLVHVTYNGPVKSARLMKDKPKEKFTFEKK